MAVKKGMNVFQHTGYMLTLLFMKYASDPYAMIVVPEGDSFDDTVDLNGNKEIGARIN